MSTAIPTEAIVTALTGAFFFLVRLFTRLARDHRNRAVFGLVTQAGVFATARAMGILRRKMLEAVSPESPGGKTITPDEVRLAVDQSAREGLSYLRHMGVLERVIAIYGGEEAIVDGVIGKMEDSLRAKGYPVGPTT